MHYLDELNEDQLKAVKTTEGYLRVIAGAGSGKTKLLVSRYVYLVSEYGINPANTSISLHAYFYTKRMASLRRS